MVKIKIAYRGRHIVIDARIAGYTSIPRRIAEALGIQPYGKTRVYTGKPEETPVANAQIEINGKTVETPILIKDGEPTIDQALLIQQPT